MALESKPKGKNFIDKATWLKGPPGAFKYKVTDGDSWNNLARRDHQHVWDLIKLNFPTDNPKEVNWYLREYVGCKVSRDGGKNWSFSNTANPGYIYTKNDLIARAKDRVPMPDGGDFDPDHYDGPLFDSGWWIGFGIKGGLSTPDLRSLGIPIPGVGAEVAAMQMVSLDSLVEVTQGIAGGFSQWNRFMLNIDSLRYDGKGIGGGGVGLVMAIVNNINHPDNLRGYRVEGEDFNLALGPLKASYVRMAGAIKPLFKALGKNLMIALKSKDAWSQVASVAKIMKTIIDQNKSSDKGTPSVQVYDLPVALAAEGSFYSYTGMTQVLYSNYRTPQKRHVDRQYPDL